MAIVSTLCLSLNAQTLLKNDGATITVENGAILKIEGTLENTNGGTIDNDGRIELEGDFINNATFDGSDPNVVAFTGTDDSEFTSNASVFDTIELDKDATKQVVLMDDLTIGSTGAIKFIADDNYVSVGDNTLIMQDGAAFVNEDNDNFVVTGGAGYLRHEDVGASETVNYPVGYEASTYNPVELMTTGSHTEDDFDVRVLENAYADGLTGTQITEEVVDATWEIVEGTDGGSEVDVTVEWDSSDELTDFDRNFSGVSRYDDVAMSWDLTLDDMGMADGANPYSQTRFGVTDFSAFLVAGGTGTQVQELTNNLLINLKVMLSGPYLSGLMKDDLRTAGLIPTAEPYASAPYNYSHEGFGGTETVDPADFDQTGTNNDIVDWVVVEVRDIADSSTVLASKSALVQRDGDVVDLDGASELMIPGLADGDYIVAVKHRNHLGVRTPVALALSSVAPATSHDFTTGQAQAYSDPGITNPPMKLQFDGKTTLYGGELDNNGQVSYNVFPTDPFQVLFAVGFATPNNTVPNVYNRADADMNGTVSYNVFPTDPFVVLNAVGFATPNALIQLHD